MITPLRLLAHDHDDLSVISAALQDAILRVGDMIFQSRQRRFAVVSNRFCWEELKGRSNKTSLFGKPLYHRVQAGMHFDSVLAVRSQYIALEKTDAVLSLLSISAEQGENDHHVITLAFAGGGTIQLDVECIDASLQDISDPWTTQNLPEHKVPEINMDDKNVE